MSVTLATNSGSVQYSSVSDRHRVMPASRHALATVVMLVGRYWATSLEANRMSSLLGGHLQHCGDDLDAVDRPCSGRPVLVEQPSDAAAVAPDPPRTDRRPANPDPLCDLSVGHLIGGHQHIGAAWPTRPAPSRTAPNSSTVGTHLRATPTPVPA